MFCSSFDGSFAAQRIGPLQNRLRVLGWLERLGTLGPGPSASLTRHLGAKDARSRRGRGVSGARDVQGWFTVVE
jgi:hypothetical protein